MQAVDNIGAASLTLATQGGPLAYTQFIQARDDFKQLLMDINRSYRYVEN